MDVQSILNAEGKRLWEEISDKCVEEISRAGQFKRMDDLTTVPDAISLPRIRKVLLENHMGKATPAIPIYIYHAIMDQLIPIATVDELVDEYCREGAAVKYHRDPASEHVALVATGAVARWPTSRSASGVSLRPRPARRQPRPLGPAARDSLRPPREAARAEPEQARRRARHGLPAEEARGRPPAGRGVTRRGLQPGVNTDPPAPAACGPLSRGGRGH